MASLGFFRKENYHPAMRKHLLLSAIALLVMTSPALACMWDSDTIAEERSKFPTAMEILAGKYNRHSPAFYEWRIKDRQTKLEKDPRNPALLDDLGVALCKTGKFKEAVEVGEREVALDPKRYESQSNLGTFYIFAGDLDKSAEHIKAALAINPDAHFGREKYQLYLVEYMMEVKKVKGEVKLPLRWPEYDSDSYKALNKADQEKAEDITHAGYCHFFKPELFEKSVAERGKAIHGVLGMMRFANDELPVLNEVAGDLFNFSYGQESDKQLAARAYLKAALHAPDSASADAYQTLAIKSLSLQDNTDFKHLEKDFQEELAQGRAYMAQIAADEAQWIAAGIDPENAFNQKYRIEPELNVNNNPFKSAREESTKKNKLIAVSVLVIGIIGIIAAIGLYVRSLRKRSKAAKAVAASSATAPNIDTSPPPQWPRKMGRAIHALFKK